MTFKFHKIASHPELASIFQDMIMIMTITNPATMILTGRLANRQEMENSTHTTEMPWWAELDQQMASGSSFRIHFFVSYLK